MKKKIVIALAAALVIASANPVGAYAAGQAANVASINYGILSKAEKNAVTQLFDAKFYAETYPDVVNALGSSEKALLNHFLTYGIFEGRNCTADFNVSAYASGYSDLRTAFEDSIGSYYLHYIMYGKNEGRSIVTIDKALDAGITVTSIATGAIIAEPVKYTPPAASTPAPATSTPAASSDSQSSSSASGDSSSSSGSVIKGNTIPNYSAETIAQYLQRVIELVNEERAKEGLSPLTESPILDSAAQVRASEITTLFEHERPDGSDFHTAIDLRALGATSCGENIAEGFMTPEKVMEGWMNSPGHRENIMRAEFTRIGVAYTTAQTIYGTYWVQLFSN